MKTKRFRLLTVLLAAIMMVVLSFNVLAAKSNGVTKDGLTAQLFTDKDSYKSGESVKVSVQVDNHTGREVFIFAQINAPEGVKLASENAAFDARLQDGETWTTPGGVEGGASASGNSTATGDNMQAGFWVILTVLAVCGIIALYVYGKNKKTWLSIMLCIAMAGGLVTFAIPVQAADVSGEIPLSCTIKVDGKDKEVTATIGYVIYDDAEEAVVATEEPTTAPTTAPTSAPTTAPTTAPTSAPTTAPTSAPTTAPTSAPTTAPTTAPTSAPTTAPTTAPTSAPTTAPTVDPNVYHKVDLTTMAEGDVVKRTVGTITEQAIYTGEQATVQVIADATEGRFIRINDSSTASTGYPGFQVSNIDFSSGVKVIEFDMRINDASGGTAVKLNVIGATNLGNAQAISLEMGSARIGYYASAVGATTQYVQNTDVKATSDGQWKKVVLTVDSDNNKFSLSYGGVSVFENANLRGDVDLNGNANLIIWTNGTTTSNVDIKNIVVTNGVIEGGNEEEDDNIYHSVDLTTMAVGDVVTRNVGAIQETTYNVDSEATVKLIEDASEGRFIKVDDGSTSKSPGFLLTNIDFSSGVKAIAFDLRINSAGGSTAAKVNIHGATNLGNTHALSLEIGYSRIGYYASAVGAATQYVSNTEVSADYGDWEKVVLFVDSDNDKFSLYYDGVPVFEDEDLRGTVDLNGNATLYLWADGAGTSDFDIKNIVIYNGEIEIEVPETPAKPQPDRTLVNYVNASESLNGALANSVAMTVGNSMARVNNAYRHIDPDNVYNAPIRNDEGEVIIPVEFMADVVGAEVIEKTAEPTVYHKLDLATVSDGDWNNRNVTVSSNNSIAENNYNKGENDTIKVVTDTTTNEKYVQVKLGTNTNAGISFVKPDLSSGIKTLSLKFKVNAGFAKIIVDSHVQMEINTQEIRYISMSNNYAGNTTGQTIYDRVTDKKAQEGIWNTMTMVLDSDKDVFTMYLNDELVFDQKPFRDNRELSTKHTVYMTGYANNADVSFKDFVIYEGDITASAEVTGINLNTTDKQMEISMDDILVKNDTRYVSLKSVAETFGKEVFEDERGLIIIADEVAASAKTEEVIKPLIAEIRNHTTLIGNKKYSDVPFSARYIRPDGHTTGTTEPQWGTYDASKRFMTTVNKWTYVTSGEDYAALYDMGYVNQGSLQPMLPASYGTSSLFFDGTKYYRSDGYGKGEGSLLWGCLSDERSYDYILSKAKEGIDSGILTWQFDDWAMNVAYASGAGCFCDKCMTGFTEYLRNNTEYAQVLADALTFMNITDATAFNYKAYIQAKGITTNDAANTFATGTDPVSQAWKAFNHQLCNDFHVKLKAAMDEYAGVEVLYSFNTGTLTTVLGANDFGYIGNFVTGIMGETSGNRTTASEIYGQMLFSRAIGVENVISPLPKTDLDKQNMYAAIPMTYATGQYLVIAWDCYLSLGARYYATLEELGGSYEFAREYPFLFDNYEIPEQVGYAYDLDGFYGYVAVGEDLLNKGVAARVVGHKDDDYQIVITKESLRGLEAVIISQTDYDNLSTEEKTAIEESNVQLIISSNVEAVANVENTYWTVRNSTEDIATVLRQNALYDNAPVVIHAVNYAGTVAENVTIEVNNRYLPEGDTLTVNVYKPWENSRTMTVTKDSDGITEITIDSVDNWTVLEVCGANTQRQEVSFDVGTGLNGIGLGTRISQDKAYATTDGFKIVTYSEGLNSTTYGDAGVQDEAAFIYKRLGYSQLTELVTSAGFEGADGAHGVMVREGLYSNARFVALMYDSENGLRIAQRDKTNEAATYTKLEGGKPNYMKLERHGSEYQAFVSEDGVSYTKVGSIKITFSEAIGGVFATSPNGSMEECVVKNFVAEEGDYLAAEEFTKFEISYGANNSIGRYTYNEKLVMDLATTNFTGLGVDDVAITFTSTNEGVVKISSDGTIIPVAPGTATITATASMGTSKSITDSIELTVVNIEKTIYQESFTGSELPSNMTLDNTAIAVTNIGGEHGYVLQAKTATSGAASNVKLAKIPVENLPITYEFDYRATFGTDQPTTGCRVLYGHGTNWQLRFIAEKDGFKWISAGDVRTKIADIEEGRWYHIKVTVDSKNNCASIWIDNTLVMESQPGFSAFSAIFEGVQLGGWRLGTDSCYEWDNINVYYDVE